MDALPAISPDGRNVAFSYKGDIYVVDAAGGTARRLTAESGYNYAPVWSPDSRQIAYAGDRYGNFDIFLIAAEGGQPRRLTTHSAAEEPYAFTPDGKQIYYGTHIWDPPPSALFPTGSMTELYSVSVTGGRPVQVLPTPAEAITFAPDGESFLYQDRKGGENIWRKHHTSSITRDIWRYDASTGRHTNLTARDGEDRNPRLADGGRTVYFLSERGGTFNVWSFPADDPAAAKQVTDFKTHPVRFLSVADNGTLCYGYNGQIYTQAAGGRPQLLNVEIVSAEPTDKTSRLSVTGGRDLTASPDGKQVAFVSRGDIFVTSVDYTTTKQITSTPQSEADPDFAPDNRSMVYASERDGYWRIYTARIARDEDPNFPNATLIDEEPLFKDDGIERTCPKYSPDGKRVAYFEDRSRLMVKDLATGKVHQVTDGSCQYSTDGNIDYAWSPDGRWFAINYIGNRHDPYSDIGLVSADGGEITNLTNTGYFDSSPQWVLDGNAILFESDRYGMRSHASWGSLSDVMIIFLNRKSYEIFRMDKEEYELYDEARKRAEGDKKRSETDNKDNKDKSADGEKKGWRHRRKAARADSNRAREHRGSHGASDARLVVAERFHARQEGADALLPVRLRGRIRPLADGSARPRQQPHHAQGQRQRRARLGRQDGEHVPARRAHAALQGRQRLGRQHLGLERDAARRPRRTRIHVRPHIPSGETPLLYGRYARRGLGGTARQLPPLPARHRQQLRLRRDGQRMARRAECIAYGMPLLAPLGCQRRRDGRPRTHIRHEARG